MRPQIRAPTLRAWAAVVVYQAAIFYLSSRSARDFNLPLWRYDKVIHLAEFAGFAFLLVRALRQSFPAWSLRRLGLVAGVIGTVSGVLDEVHQRWVPGRISSVGDVVSDAAGTALAIGLYLWLLRRQDAAVGRTW